MPHRTTSRLLDDHRRGDLDAFRVLVDRHQGALLRYARFLTPAGEEAEDVVQDVFLRLAQRPPELPPEARQDERLAQAHLASWLYRVTRNRAMELVRSDTRRRARERLAAPPEAGPRGLPAHEARDIREAVERGLRALPDAQREVLVLRLLGDRSYQEIAELTGKPTGTIAWLISVGLRQLADLLAPDLDRDATPAAGVRALGGASMGGTAR